MMLTNPENFTLARLPMIWAWGLVSMGTVVKVC